MVRNIFTAAVSLLFVNTFANAAALIGLGDLAGGDYFSEATAISADGQVVVGASRSSTGLQSFRWSRSTGMVGLGDLTASVIDSQALGVSADGSVIVGVGSSSLGPEAFRWTEATGMQGLGMLSGSRGSVAADVSGDGKTIVGWNMPISGGIREAFSWTETSGMARLEDLAGGGDSSAAYAISADGQVTVGYGSSFLGGTRMARWPPIGIEDLGSSGEARAASAAGNVVVGWGTSDGNHQAVRWNSTGGLSGLGYLGGATTEFSQAEAVSADGQVIVGLSESSTGVQAFIWDESSGMRSIRDVLIDDYGIDLSGWRLSEALGISADGQTIVGWGVGPSGGREAWVAILDRASVPEPGTLFLVFAALGAAIFNGMRPLGSRTNT